MLYNTENPHGGDIYAGGILLDFSANTNPFGMPEGVKAAVRACIGSLDRYPDPYCRRLVSLIAEKESLPKEYVLCGAGAAELIYSFAFSEAPKRVLELAPTFSEYTMPLGGAKIDRFILREENGFAVGAELIEFIQKCEPSAVFLCSPNNPTGRLIEHEILKSAALLCRERGIRLFLDECFLELASGGESLSPLLSECPELIILRAFTKSFGMAGVRLGYALCSDAALLERMSRTVQPWNISTAAQAAGEAAIKETAFLEESRRFIQKERSRLEIELSRLGLTVFPSDANFLLFKAEAGLDERLLEKGIKIRSCSNYHGLTEGYYRIAVRLEYENDLLLAALRSMIEV